MSASHLHETAVLLLAVHNQVSDGPKLSPPPVAPSRAAPSRVIHDDVLHSVGSNKLYNLGIYMACWHQTFNACERGERGTVVYVNIENFPLIAAQ